MNQLEQLQQAARFALEVLLWSQAGEPVPSMEREAIEQLKQALNETVS